MEARCTARCTPTEVTSGGEPAWDMLLTLFVAQAEGRHLPVSALCLATPVPVTTAHRWILVLTGSGLAVRIGDPEDGRRSYVYLFADGLRRTGRVLRDVLPDAG